MNKKAVKYLRFSSEEQSHFSIERQDMITGSWMQHANIELVDTFIDQGFSATNFDRPDFKKLNSFIEKNYRNIDYLVVSDLTRFSRELGDAVNIVKKIQKTYGIRIVSAGRGAIYDCTDHNSFFMMALEFLLGNTENLKRMNDINGGIYTAKAINQRYIGPRPPFGYRREGKGKNSILVIVEEEATVIRCGRLLTGAPSRGKSGKYFYYYKCPITSKHNNISVIKSQEQLEEAFRYMSLNDKMVKSIIMKSEHNLQAKTKDKTQQLDKKRSELEKVETDLHHLEKKWLEEQINQDTYNRWHADYTKQRNYLRSQIDQLSKDYSDTHALLKQNISLLTDIRNLYVKCTTLQKQELIRAVFDNSLYYEDHIYRTPYLIPELAHNDLKMKEKGLLIVTKKGDSCQRIPSSGGEGIRTPVQT
jgi:DNA invertase Pin-like site-specific DNA recombinase